MRTTAQVTAALAERATRAVVGLVGSIPRCTEVMDLRTSRVYSYGHIPADEAVVLAFRQFDRKDFNWWDYASRADTPELEWGARTVTCGDFSAFQDGRPIRGG